jgi:hypothetical protein
MSEKGFPECLPKNKQILNGLCHYKAHITMEMPKANATITVHIAISQTCLRSCMDLDAGR